MSVRSNGLFPRGQRQQQMVFALVAAMAIFGSAVANSAAAQPDPTPTPTTTTLPADPAPPVTGESPPAGANPPRAAGPMNGETCGVSQWVSPVTAPIVDPFRPPSNPYGPGNRGNEYATSNGDQVLAVDAGEVVFVGPVGGDRFIVIRHTGNLRSTYGYLTTTDVSRGEVVAGGAPIATAGPGFHLTARHGESYIDPAPLLAERCFVVRLVPLPRRGERRTISPPS